jgi:cytoskeletal protein CcmA (bactofilin family)
MLRMGKNPKDQPESEHTTDNPATPQYGAQRSHSSYQSTEAQPRSASDGQAGTPTRAVTESESLARDIKDGILSGFVGSGTMLTGEATFKGMLRVDGHLSGRISSEGGTLIVGNNGQVDANVEVAVATIHGTVNGDIVASQRLELGRAAKVNGNIQTPSLVIEQGALFEGSCRMVALKAALDKQREVKSRDHGTLAAASGSSTYAGSTAAEPKTSVAEASSVSEVAS